jgi:cob(I)alamin adenosyltransferase
MKIYTRTGDEGSTGLYGGGRVLKCDARIAACGAVDELNASLGACRCAQPSTLVDEVLVRLQHEMFALGAELATPKASASGSGLMSDREINRAERDIDRFEADLAPLQNFILPGGSVASAALHLARAVCRRAEREVVALSQSAEVRPAVLMYLNRISDLLFVLARHANHTAGAPDVLWEKDRSG